MEAWNQGTEEGHVVADLLLGVVNPSAKVPTSYPRSEADPLYAGRPERHPGTDEGDGYPVIRYSEGLQTGYRWFQAQGIQPLFGFGFGLFYTTFDIADVAVDAPDGTDAPIAVTASVTNRPRGRRRGGTGVSRGACGGTSPPSDSSGSRRCSWSRGSRSR
jgi:beta-glucosidase